MREPTKYSAVDGWPDHTEIGLSTLTNVNAKDTSTFLEEELTCTGLTDPEEPPRVTGEDVSAWTTCYVPDLGAVPLDLPYCKVLCSRCEHTSAGGTF